MIAKAREKASNMLEASVEDIEYRDGWLTVVGTDKRIGLFEIAKKESGARLSVDSEGEVDGPSWPNGTHICEVEIDPETGVTQGRALHHGRRRRRRRQSDAGDRARCMAASRRASVRRCMKAWPTTPKASC